MRAVSRPLRVVALTSGEHTPSSRFRVRQYIPRLASRGVEVREHASRPEKFTGRPFYVPAALWRRILLHGRREGLRAAAEADLVWLERELVSGERTWEHRAGRPERRLFDVDDAIWMNGPRDFSESIVRECAGVIAGNEFLADHYRPHAKRTWVVPTSVDPARWRVDAAPRGAARFTVGWTGTSGNYPFLRALERPLAQFLGERDDAEFLVVADRPLDGVKIPRMRFERWTEAGEPAQVRAMDVGVMPLPDTEWARGKCAAKMLVYLAAERPAVVSPVGVNAEVLARGDVGLAARTDDDWYRHFVTLYEDRERAREMGRRGLALVESTYSVDVCAETLVSAFTEVAGA